LEAITKTDAEIDQELADVIIRLHDAKPEVLEQMMAETAPPWLVAFADEVLAAR
jgi:predicted Zn-dependent protease with MMP-like domain